MPNLIDYILPSEAIGTASNQNNQDSWIRCYKYPCKYKGLDLLYIVKGCTPGKPWSVESLIVDPANNEIRMVGEAFYWVNYSDPLEYHLRILREFRLNSDPGKGVHWCPLNFTTSTWKVIGNNTERYYSNSDVTTDKPVSYYGGVAQFRTHPKVPQGNDNSHTDVVGSLTHIETYHKGASHWASMVYDYRTGKSGSLVTGVDIVEVAQYWGTNNKESYFYGRWQNPDNGQWQPIGLVNWAWWEGGVLKSQVWYDKVVSTSALSNISILPK